MKAIDTARKANTNGAKVKQTVANRAAMRLNGLRNTLRDWFRFYDGYDPMFTWWCDDPYKKADVAIESYGKFVREKLAGLRPGDEETIVGDPVGRQALLNDLSNNMIPYTPEELVALAKQELAWCEQEMMKASREIVSISWRSRTT